MKLIYRPAEGDVQTFNLGELSDDERLLALSLSGGVPLSRAMDGHPLALRIGLFLAQRRIHPSLLWIDCNPAPGEVVASIEDGPEPAEKPVPDKKPRSTTK